MDTNILIRTITAARGWWQIPVGGGIVADSDPAARVRRNLAQSQGHAPSPASVVLIQAHFAAHGRWQPRSRRVSIERGGVTTRLAIHWGVVSCGSLSSFVSSSCRARSLWPRRRNKPKRKQTRRQTRRQKPSGAAASRAGAASSATGPASTAATSRSASPRTCFSIRTTTAVGPKTSTWPSRSATPNRKSSVARTTSPKRSSTTAPPGPKSASSP